MLSTTLARLVIRSSSARRLAVSGVVLFSASACAGGWTGEITDLTACDTVVGERALEALPERDAAALRDAEAVTTRTLTWHAGDGTETELTIAVRASGATVEEIGGEACTTPFFRVPVELTLVSADGRLDDTLRGTLDLHGASSGSGGSISARATMPAAELRGSLALDADGVVRADVVRDASGETDEGTLFFSPATGEIAEGDQTLLASW